MAAPYSPTEERLNIWTHASGIPLAVIALIFMLKEAEDYLSTMSALCFGLSLISLYSASTFYHAATDPGKRTRLRVFDHSAIYLLIAGTYTPLCLITLQGRVGNLLFVVIWTIALVGITLKLFFTGRFKVLSTLLYVGMGWTAVFVYRPISESLSIEGIQWVLAGGVSYTVGALLYNIKKIPFNHAVFHCCVLGGSVCHFVAVYQYIL